VVDLVNGDRIHHIRLDLEFGRGVVVLKDLIVALGGVDHEEFEESAERVHDLFADDEIPIEGVYLLV
jgi:hypothetical protein